MKSILRTLALSGVVAAAAVAGQAQAQAQVGIAVRVGPSAPAYYDDYVPPCPGLDFIWTPGYYAGGLGARPLGTSGPLLFPASRLAL